MTVGTNFDAAAALRTQGLTMQAIGNQLGITRERVRQILKQQELSGLRGCLRCGTPTPSRKRICRACVPPKPKRKLNAGYFVCSKCGQGFVLTGVKLTQIKRNQRKLHTKNAWCPDCRAERVYGPEYRPCGVCGTFVAISHQQRYWLKRGVIKTVRCPEHKYVGRLKEFTNCTICGRGGRIRRGWCDTHYSRWSTKGSPLADVPIRKMSSRKAVMPTDLNGAGNEKAPLVQTEGA